MKKTFSKKLLAISLIVLAMVSIMAITSFAAPGLPTFTGSTGTSFTDMAWYHEGFFEEGLVFKVAINSGYMKDDADFKVVLLETQDNGEITRTEIGLQTNGAYAGFYRIPSYTYGRTNVVIEGVTPIAVALSGDSYVDYQFAAVANSDGVWHTYTLTNFANHGNITVITPSAAMVGFFKIAGTFANFGTIEFTSSVRTNDSWAITNAGASLINRGTFTVSTRSPIILGTFTNQAEGTLVVTNAVYATTDTAARLYVYGDFSNYGDVAMDRGQLIVGGSYGGTAYYSNFYNAGTIQNDATALTVELGKFTNTATGVITMNTNRYIDCITGVQAASGNTQLKPVTGTLLLNGILDVDGTVINHVNDGVILIDSDFFAQPFFVFKAKLTNNGTFTIQTSYVAGNNVEGGSLSSSPKQSTINTSGLLINNGTFTVQGFALNYNITSEGAYIENRPLGITNNGTLALEVVSNDGVITNNAQMSINGLLVSNKLSQACVNDIIYTITSGYFINNEGAIFDNNGKSSFTYLYNAGTINNNKSIFVVYDGGIQKRLNKDDLVLIGSLVNDGIIENNNYLENGGHVYNNNIINNTGTIFNTMCFFVNEGAVVYNDNLFQNGDCEIVTCLLDTVGTCSGFLKVTGSFVNNNTFNNAAFSDLRVEGEFDNTNGLFTNDGCIVNVGSFLTTVAGLDNRFAIEGYDITYVTEADDAEITTAATTTKAATAVTTAGAVTSTPTKTPASQTSDVAVAGFAILATLALAGVVVAKKVR